MDRYQLARLVQWAEDIGGQLKSRKKMQKVVFLLQCAGCPFNAEYSLHHYGPYSAEVAQLTDELVQIGVLNEESSVNHVGRQFSYRLTDQAKEAVAAFEESVQGRPARDEMSRFADRAKELLREEIPRLEYGATIAYFRAKGFDWDESFQKACEFKGLNAGSLQATSALDLAKQFVD